LKKKIEAGAEYIVTQMFYDNSAYFNFVDKCQAAGVEAPIIPGLKIAASANQIKNIPRNFYVDIPSEFTKEMLEAKPELQLEVGVNWALKQAQELLDCNVPALHFYIMQDSKPVSLLMQKLGY